MRRSSGISYEPSEIHFTALESVVHATWQEVIADPISFTLMVGGRRALLRLADYTAKWNALYCDRQCKGVRGGFL
jgi:hypothetical protein